MMRPELRNMMNVEEKPVTPFVLSLIGGVFILLGAFTMSIFAFGTMRMMNMMGMMSGMMTSMYDEMGMGATMGSARVLGLLGLASGTMVILGAVLIYTRPAESQVWGTVVLAFSLVSILGSMGGFLVGLILGVIGGSLALSWKSNQKPSWKF